MEENKENISNNINPGSSYGQKDRLQSVRYSSIRLESPNFTQAGAAWPSGSGRLKRLTSKFGKLKRCKLSVCNACVGAARRVLHVPSSECQNAEASTSVQHEKAALEAAPTDSTKPTDKIDVTGLKHILNFQFPSFSELRRSEEGVEAPLEPTVTFKNVKRVVKAPRDNTPAADCGPASHEPTITFKRKRNSGGSPPAKRAADDSPTVVGSAQPKLSGASVVASSTSSSRSSQPNQPSRRALQARDQIKVNGATYVKLETIGRGGSSRVYRVLGPDFHIYAMKRIKLRRTDTSSTANFRNEIRLLERLRGRSNIVQLIDAEIDLPRKQILVVCFSTGV